VRVISSLCSALSRCMAWWGMLSLPLHHRCNKRRLLRASSFQVCLQKSGRPPRLFESTSFTVLTPRQLATLAALLAHINMATATTLSLALGIPLAVVFVLMVIKPV
jgi:hypothetical protein